MSAVSKRERERSAATVLELQRRDENLATYSVGDYVMCYSPAGGGNLQLGVVLDARPKPGGVGGPYLATNRREYTWWSVRVRFATGWSTHALDRRVQRALTAAELAHNRKLGLVPREGLPEALS